MNTLTDGSILRALGVVIERDEAGVARLVDSRAPIADGQLVSVCAWCDFDKTQTRALLAQGKRVTHGICPAHSRQQIERAKQLNLQKATEETEAAA